MRPYRPGVKSFVLALAFALALNAANALPAGALIWGAIAPGTARAGDWVQLSTDAGDLDPNVYASIAKTGPTPVFLQPADPGSAGNSCDTPVGVMTWAGGVGTLQFQVPSVPPGPYWILITSDGACTRFGTRAGDLLTLTVLAAGAPGPSPALLAAIAAMATAVAVGVLMIRRRRRNRDRRRELV
jgi:hypothetical protein